MKEGTLVWIVASIEDDTLQVGCGVDDVVVNPHGYKGLPLYTDKNWVKPLNKEEIENYNTKTEMK